MTQSVQRRTAEGHAHLLQPAGPVLGLLGGEPLGLPQPGQAVPQLSAQQGVLLPKLLHRHAQLRQGATAALTLLTQTLGGRRQERRGGEMRREERGGGEERRRGEGEEKRGWREERGGEERRRERGGREGRKGVERREKRGKYGK